MTVRLVAKEDFFVHNDTKDNKRMKSIRTFVV
jgi:hypothetical protein